MSARNLSIVFSPTLGIQAAVFTLMISEFDGVFARSIDSEDLSPDGLKQDYNRHDFYDDINDES